MKTNVEYMYRDASNWKFYGNFVVDGKVEQKDLAPYLIDAEWFDPQKIGLPHLLTMPKNEDDHVLHELLNFNEPKDFEEADYEEFFCTSEELVAKFKEQSLAGWN